MTRAEFLRRMVLNEICDDFENVDQIILPNVAGQARKLGLVVERNDIIEALRGLVEDDLAKAYDLRNGNADVFSGELSGMPSLEPIEEDYRTYFYVTPKGKAMQASDRWWPFDEEGSVRPDWRLSGCRRPSARSDRFSVLFRFEGFDRIQRGRTMGRQVTGGGRGSKHAERDRSIS